MRLLIILFASFFLSGCFSVYKDTFNCKPKPGIGCESVSLVNELVDEEKLDEFIEKEKRCKKCTPQIHKISQSTIQPKNEMRVLFRSDEEQEIVIPIN